MSCAVNSYALISGYVGWDKEVRYGRIIELWCQVSFYTIGLTMLLRIIRPDMLYLDAYINAFFPITSGQYWYITAYFGLMIFLPFLNHGIQKMNSTQLLLSAGLMLGAFVLLPSCLPDFSIGEGYGLSGGFSTLWLATLYIFGAILNKYHILHRIKKKRGYALFISASIFSFGFMIVFSHFQGKVPFSWFNAKRFMVTTEITMLLEGVALLTVFEKVKLGRAFREIVLFLAPSTLGVYLFHEFPLLKYNILQKLFDGFANKPMFEMIALILGSSCAIYAVGICIDLVRRILFYKLNIRRSCNELAKKIDAKVEKVSLFEMEE